MVRADELDSFLYQTVGQDALHLVVQALNRPLVRRTIGGRSIDTSLTYSASSGRPTAGDETEDLVELLSDVKVCLVSVLAGEARLILTTAFFRQTRWPNVEAVAVGAILSTYQRVRVEHVSASQPFLQWFRMR